MAQPVYLSSEALEKLQSELEHLRTVRRKDAAGHIQQAKERGGTTGNAEYEEAKNELAFTEGRILTLDTLINDAIIIKKHEKGSDIVEVGSTVTVQTPDGKSRQYTITGSTEADPAVGRVSNVSPIGKALLGRKVGEVTEINAPSGKIKIEILAID